MKNDKNLYNVENEGDLKDAIENLTDYIEQEDAEEKNKRLKGFAFWGLSFVLHAMTIGMLSLLMYTITAEPEQELAPARISTIIPPPPKVKDPEKDRIRDIIEKQVLIESENETTDKGPVSNLDLPEDVVTTTEDENNSDVAKGREEAVSDMEMGGQGFLNFMGAGGGGSGMFGSRIGGGKNRAKAKMGPYGKESDSATDAGLRWLMRHQSPNGMWSATRYFMNCVVGDKCEPGKDASGDEDVAMSGYAVLCFLGAGFDHKTPSRYTKVVKNGINYLISIQKPDGLMGERNYEHAIAAMALIEAYGMSNDVDLRKPAQLAVDSLISRQAIENVDDPYSGLLWDYTKANPSRNDLSINGWVLMTLKSAIGTGLNTKNAMDGAKKSIIRVWKASNPDWEKKTDPYKDTTIFPYTWNAITNATDKDHLSFVGATCAVFMGHRSGDIMLETLMNDSMNRWINNGKYKNNSYSVYYILLSAFQMGGDRWKTVLNTVVPHLISTQIKSEDCLDGSWGYNGQQWHGADTSRVLSTTFAILSLEVAYRYALVNKDVKLPKR